MKPDHMPRRMREICDITSSRRVHASDYASEGIPFYRGKEIIEKFNKQEVAAELYITPEKFIELSRKNGYPEAGDILLTSVGTLGVPYVVKGGEKFYFKDGNLTWFRNLNGVDSSYLRYWLLSPIGRGELKKCQIGSSQPAYTIVLLKEMEIDLPPLPTQRKIASILSAYDDLIENNTRRVRVLEDMARALYREWFVEYRFPGHEQAEFVEDEHGRRPAGWEHKQLGDLAFELRRSVDPTEVDPETRYVGLEHIPRRRLALDDWGTAASIQSTKLRFDEGDILFGKIRPYFHKVSVAPMGGVCSTDAIVIKSMKPQWGPLVTMTVFSDEFVDHSVQTSNGTKMPRASWPVLTKYPVTVPPAALLERFNAVIEGVIQQGASLTLRNANLRRTRDLLLPRLVSGELDVSGLDISGVDDAAMGQEEMA